MTEWTSVDDAPEWWSYPCEGLTKGGRVIDWRRVE